MQNAWRFVEKEALRERLKEAKGIGTPATRAEIIGGLKRQFFLTAEGKNIVPTETGLALFGVLQKADPDLVDPGVTAQLECLLDDVVIGKQGMIGAIDEVCNVALRMIGKLKEGGPANSPVLLGKTSGDDAGTRPPTAAMKRFVVSLARQKNIKPPAGYTKSSTICRNFFEQHAPKKTSGETATRQPPGATETLAMHKSSQSIPDAKPAKGRQNASAKTKRTAAVKKSRISQATPATASSPAQQNAEADTPLRIPYGNKEIALKLGARYRPGGWYAPPGVDLAALISVVGFSEKGPKPYGNLMRATR